MPRYLQVAAALRRRIREGQWRLGERITTIAGLQEEFSVARVTVRQAIELLEQEGLLRSVQGKGTFVTGEMVADRWLRLAADWRGLIDPIRENVPKALPVRGAPPAPRLRPEDGTPAPAYAYLRSVQKRGGKPFALASVHVAQDVYRKDPDAFRSRVALAVLVDREGARIARARMSFAIGAADVEAARHLKLALDTPIVTARGIVTDAAGVAIYVGEFVYPADVVQFDVDLAGPVRL